MHAYPVSEAEAPAMYRIVRELSTRGRQADAAPLHLADPGAQRLRDRPQPRERRRLLHRGHPRPARRARAARGARPRAHARLQPRHPHALGGGGHRGRHLDDRPVPVVRHDLRRRLERRGPQPDRRPRAGDPRAVRRDGRRSSRSRAPASTTPTRTAPASPATRWPSPRRCASSSSAWPAPRSPRPSRSSTRAT